MQHHLDLTRSNGVFSTATGLAVVIAFWIGIFGGATAHAQDADSPEARLLEARPVGHAAAEPTVQTASGNPIVRPASHRRTPLVRAVARAQSSVVNIRGQKSVAPTASSSQSIGRQVNGMGTGIVIDARGYILTNYHVVQDVRQIRVTTPDGQTTTGELVARDEATDLAIIKIRPSQPLNVMTFGNSSDVMLGESVAAIGNAYGYENTVTVGIVSSLKRKVHVTESQVYENLIQTDTAINPGNSGGPLINMDGEMIGVNVAVRVNAQGIAFAIPVNEVLAVAQRLVGQLTESRVSTGIQARTIYLGEQTEVVVSAVAKGSAADEVGLRVGDRILSVDGNALATALDWQTQLLSRSSGESVAIKVNRSTAIGEPSDPAVGEEITLSLRSAALDRETWLWRVLGVKLAPVGQKTMRRFGTDFERGMQVVEVRGSSPASQANLTKGDIVVAMDGWKTESLGNVDYIVRQPKIRQSQPFDFYLYRGSQALTGQMRVRHFP